MTPSEPLAALGLELALLSEPAAAYPPAVPSGSGVWTSAQLPLVGGIPPLSGKGQWGLACSPPTTRHRWHGPLSSTPSRQWMPRRGPSSASADREARRIRCQRPVLDRSARGRQGGQRAAGDLCGAGGAHARRAAGWQPSRWARPSKSSSWLRSAKAAAPRALACNGVRSGISSRTRCEGVEHVNAWRVIERGSWGLVGNRLTPLLAQCPDAARA